MNDWTNESDEKLVSLYGEGESKAFDLLLNRYNDKLYSYIYFIIRNAEAAEDIFQETFIKAIVTIRQGRYSENGKFYAWLRRIAHNLIIDAFRQEKNENLISCDEDELNILNNANLSEGNIENNLVNQQVLLDVRKLIDFLPDDQREVVFMRYYQELSFKEIAEATDVSINTSLGRMRYAIMNLRRLAEKNDIVLTIA